MAVPELIVVRDLSTSQYAQLFDNLDIPLTELIVRAEAAIRKRLNYYVSEKAHTETFVASSQTVFVRHRPISAVTTAKRRESVLYSWTTLDVTRLTFDAEVGWIKFIDDVKGYELEITYTAGYDEIPADIKEAVILQCVLFAVQDLEVYGSGDAKVPGYLYIQSHIDRIIERHEALANVWH